MKRFKEYIKELTVTDRESSNVEDRRDPIGGLMHSLNKKPPSVIDWAKGRVKAEHPSTVKPPNAIEPEQANKELSDTFQKATTPTPANRMDYKGKIPIPPKDSLGDS
jgi:hypothetical protein